MMQMLKTSRTVMMHLEKFNKNFSKLPNLHCKKMLPCKKLEKIKSTRHSLPVIACGINVSITVQDKRFERQLKKIPKRLHDFLGKKTEKDHQHEMREIQLLMSLQSLHQLSLYSQSSSIQQFYIWR